MREYIRYNRENYKPDLFMRPPTECAHNELKYLIGGMDEKIKRRFGDVNKVDLLIGTELEVFFFSPDIDPVVGYETLLDEENPNYGEEHREKMHTIQTWSTSVLQEKYAGRFDKWSNLGRIFFEFRTMPQTCAKYLDTVDLFRSELGCVTRRLNVLPLVHSQHIHMSATGETKKVGFFITSVEDFLTPIFENDYYRWEHACDSAFNHLLPLVLLPEEWGNRNNTFNAGEKDFGCIHSKTTLESRKLSSEYANDHVLNLLLSLKMLDSFGDHKQDTNEIAGPDSYKTAARMMANYRDLKVFFGESVIAKLSSITEQYPDVSRRKITIEEVKR
jgi:hypothetical protein